MKPAWLAFAVALAAFLVVRRRKLEPTLLAGGGIVAAAALLYGLGVFEIPNVEKLLTDLGRHLGKWTYLLVAVLAFAETGAFIGLLAPGETVILVGGVVAGQGQIDIVVLIAIVWACAVGGDLTSFFLGRKLGRPFLEHHGRKVAITEERLQKVEGFFDRYGGRAILLGRFVGLVRAIAPFLAGSSGMPLRRFLPYDVIGAGLWGSTFCLLGYLFWQSFGSALNYAKTGALALGATIAMIVGIVVLVRFLRVPENRARVRAWLAVQAERPALRPFATVLRPVVRVLSGPARFAWDRVTPGDLGLELTTLLAVVGVGAFAVTGLAIQVGPGVLAPGDASGLRLATDLRTGAGVSVAKVVTTFGTLRLTLGATVIVCAVLAVRREVLEATAIASGYALMLLAEQLIRAGEDRARPGAGLVETTTQSFPSAHAAHSVAWVAIAVALARVLPGWGARAVVVVASVVLAAAVALSRIYLHVHYPSDVVAGAGMAAACFAVCGVAALLVDHLRHTGGRA